MASVFQLHVEKWSDCVRCDLHRTRNKVVISRGQIPADVVFIGEAPGESENVLGIPFVGPAGKLLDKIVERIREAVKLLPHVNDEFRIAFTNVVCCIPRDDDREKLSEPGEREISACRPRLTEFLQICKPKVIVRVGKVAEQSVPPRYVYEDAHYCDILHPAYILRQPFASRSLGVKRCVVTVVEAIDRVYASKPFTFISPRHRTSAVNDLIEQYRDTSNPTLLPILGDALTEAGCTDSIIVKLMGDRPQH